MLSRAFFLTIVLLPVCGLIACGGQEAPAENPPAEAEAGAPTTYPEPAPPVPSPVPAPALTPPPGSGAPAPVTSRTPTAGDAITAPGAAFSMPAAWRAEAPSSSMRLAQAAIPGPDGDGQLTVFYFGPGGGGGVDANIDRWVGQMDVAPGTQPSRETFDVGGFRVTWVEVQGTIMPSTMGIGPTEPQPGSRMLGAVVEGAQGPWFFKASGPAATLDAQRDAFLSMLRSVRTP
ncbi:MAG: hypothetical protein AAGM22_14905 [Acidobacteriota bacterium]